MSTKIYGKITVIKRNGAIGSQLPVTGSTCTFGKESDCEIRIQLPTVSSHECQLVADENGRFVVSKLNKKGEILVNDKALGTQAAVNHNDVLTIAGRSFRFEYPPQQREKMASGKAPVGTPRPSAVDRLRQTERRRVSFGPQLSPEQFDLALPPNTPVKRGAIPMKNLSNTEEINRHCSMLKAAKRRNAEKTASPKSVGGKKEKTAKKKSFDKLVELVGLDKPQKTEPGQRNGEEKTEKTTASDQLDFFGAIKKTPKATSVYEVKSRHDLLTKSGELDESLQDVTEVSVASSTSKTPKQKKRRSDIATPQQPVNTVSHVALEVETEEFEGSETRRSVQKAVKDATDAVPVGVVEGQLATPAQKRRSKSKCDTPVAADTSTIAATPSQKKRRSKVMTPQTSETRRSVKKADENLNDTLPAEVVDDKPETPVGTVTKDEATTPAQKKRRSKVMTPQPSADVVGLDVATCAEIDSTAMSNGNSDVIQSDENKSITPKQKRISVSKSATPTLNMDVRKPKTPKGQTHKSPVHTATSSEELSGSESTKTTPSQKHRSMSKSVTPMSTKKEEDDRPSSAEVLPKELDVSTPVGKRKSLPEQQSDSLDGAVVADHTIKIDDEDQKQIVLIVQEQTPAKQPIPTQQPPDMVLEIGVETPVAAPRSEKERRRSGRFKTPHTDKQPGTPVSQRRRSFVAQATKSPHRIPSNSAILTARRKSLRHRKSGLLLWSDVVRKNTNKQVDPKLELNTQLQKVTKATRRSLPRTPKQTQLLRHVDSPATIYIGRKTRPRRSFTPAALDMSEDWTSDDGNTTVEDSFVLLQSNANIVNETIDCDAADTMKTPKVKGQPVEDHFGTKRLLKTPKDKVKNQPVEEHYGTKRLLKTPQEKVRGQPVEEHFGTKRLLHTPKEKTKSQPVEKNFGTKRLLTTPKEKVKGQPVEKHFGTSRLLKTPVDKVKGEPVQDEFGTKRLFCSPKVKGQPVVDNFGTKRLLHTPEIKRKNEPVEDEFCIDRIFGYEADVDESVSDVAEARPSTGDITTSSKSSEGKAESGEAATINTEDTAVIVKLVKRVSTRAKRSSNKQSSDTESDSGERRSTRRSKVKSTASDSNETMEIDHSSKKRKASDDSDSSGSTKKRQDTASTKKRTTTRGNVAKKEANQGNSEAAAETPSKRRSGRTRAQKTDVDLTEKPKVASPKTKLTAIPEVDEPNEAAAVSKNSNQVDVEPACVEISESVCSEEEVVLHKPVVELPRVSKPTRTTSSKATESRSSRRKAAAKKPDTSETENMEGADSVPTRSTRKSEKTTKRNETRGNSSVKTSKTPNEAADGVTVDLRKISEKPEVEIKLTKADGDSKKKATEMTATKPVAVRALRHGKVAQPQATVVENETSETEMQAPIENDDKHVMEKPLKKPQAAPKKTKSDDTKSKVAEVTEPVRTTRRGKVAETKNEPLTKKAKAKDTTKMAKAPAKRTTRGAKSKPVKDDSKQEVNQTDKKTVAMRKRKTSDDDVKMEKTTDAKPSKATRSTAVVSEPVRKSSRVRNAK